MILAALALALQPGQPTGPPLAPEAMIEGFRSTCVRHLADLDALRAAILRSPLGFARSADAGRWEIYRAESATIRIYPGEGCSIDARLPSLADGTRVIDRAYAAVDMRTPQGTVNRDATGPLYATPELGAASRLGLTASLNWDRVDATLETPVFVSLSVFWRSAP
jgi:hypothetical protein